MRELKVVIMIMLWILWGLTYMTVNDWCLEIGPQHAMVYNTWRGEYEAHIIFYSNGHYEHEFGGWVNAWKLPNYQHVKRPSLIRGRE